MPNLISANRSELLEIKSFKKTTINILIRARRSFPASRRTRAESIWPLSSTNFFCFDTNVASFPRSNIYKKEDTGKLPLFANFGRGYFDFCLSPGQKLGCERLGSTFATIDLSPLYVVTVPYTSECKCCFCEHT